MPTYTRAQLDAMPEEERNAIVQKHAAQQAGGKVIQEMQPGLDFGERFALKNLSDNTDDQARFLKKKYGDRMDVGLKNGQIVLRNKGEADWRVLDPEGFDLNDISDIAGDTASGFLSGLASTASGLAAGAATGGVGAIPAAALAGGASSAGIETIKQWLAQKYGVKTDDLDGGDIALQGAFGVASPLLFGVGGSAKQIAKAAAPENVARKLVEQFTEQEVGGALTAAQKATAREALASSSEGLIPRVGRGVTAWLSGSDEEALRTARTMLPKVAELEKSGATKEFLNNAAEQSRTAFNNKLSEIGDNINKVVDASGAVFDVNEYRQPFIAEIQRLAKSTSTEDRLLADEIRQEMETIFKQDVVDKFGRTIGEKPMEYASAHEMEGIKASLLDLAKGRKKANGLSAIAGQDRAPARMRAVASQAGTKAASDFDKTVIKLAEDPAHRNLLQDYKTIQQLRNNLGPKMKDAETAQRTLGMATNKNKRNLFESMQEADRLLGTDLADKAKTMEAFKTWNKPSWSAISSRGSTSTSKTGTSGIAGAGAADLVSDAVEAPSKMKNLLRAAGALGLTTAVSPAAQRKYFELTQPLMNGLSKVPNKQAIGQSMWDLLQAQGAE